MSDNPMQTADERMLSWLRAEASQQGRQFAETPPESNEKNAPQIFVSYARADWDSFVAPLVERLRGDDYTVWVDQHLIAGGSDWMDTIGAALDECAVLLLIMSPDALKSRYVKMEYRHFIFEEKPLLPVLLKLAKRPPELNLYQYIDYTGDDHDAAYNELRAALDRALNTAQS